jgi:Type IV secretion system pilin
MIEIVTLLDYLVTIPEFLGQTVVPFLFGIAFIIFVVQAVRYFIIGGSNDDNHDKAKDQVLYSLAAFVFLMIFWGIINLIALAVDFYYVGPPCPDYLLGSPNSPCARPLSGQSRARTANPTNPVATPAADPAATVDCVLPTGGSPVALSPAECQAQFGVPYR